MKMKTPLVSAIALAVCAAAAASGAYAKGGPGVGLTNRAGVHFSRSSGAAHPSGTPAVCISPVGRTANGDAFTGDPSNSLVELDIGAGNAVLGVGADATVTANSPSWLSEAAVMFSSSEAENDPNSVYLTVSDTDSSGTEEVSTEGPLMLGDFGLDPIAVGADGILRLEWFETFDDDSVDPDSNWSDHPSPAVCSGISLVCTDQAACDAAVSGGGPTLPPEPYSYVPVPTLSQWALALLGAGLAFLSFRVRRRQGSRN